MANNSIDKEHLDWNGLVRYTDDFKSWILSLFHKVHARIGHVEEDLYEIKKTGKTKYSLTKYSNGDSVVYSLIDETTLESHGDIRISADASISLATWNEDLRVPSK